MMMDIEIANEYQNSSNPRLLLVYFMAKTNFEIMRLTLILVSSFLILMGSNPSYASRVRFRRDKKRPVQQPSKGQKQTDEEYPDHGQSNLGKLLSI